MSQSNKTTTGLRWLRRAARCGKKTRRRSQIRLLCCEPLETRQLLAGVAGDDLANVLDTATPIFSETMASTIDLNPITAAVPGTHSGGMTIEGTLSDEAQETTIAFDGLAFLTGSLGADSFFPPGKVADFWGFQYLRDNDPSQMGHSGNFLTKAANNVLYILTPSQRSQLVALAESQVDSINQYAYDRFALMDAFRRLLEGDIPAGSTGLDLEAVKDYSAELYRLDGQISFERGDHG